MKVELKRAKQHFLTLSDLYNILPSRAKNPFSEGDLVEIMCRFAVVGLNLSLLTCHIYLQCISPAVGSKIESEAGREIKKKKQSLLLFHTARLNCRAVLPVIPPTERETCCGARFRFEAFFFHFRPKNRRCSHGKCTRICRRHPPRHFKLPPSLNYRFK